MFSKICVSVSKPVVFVAFLFGITCAGDAEAGGVQTLDAVEVSDSADDPVGSADTASEGTIVKQQIDSRPVYREGELLENVPGLIVTQHSGEGKANQYFLRGFNLDHGTDIAITVDDMPVNMRSNAHGQGYSDLNFMIPELANDIQYRKGPYFAEEGDFDTAGAVHINYLNRLDKDIAEAGAGSFGYARGMTAMSCPTGSNPDDGTVLAAAEYNHLDGPWVHPDDYNKGNMVLRYSKGSADNGWSGTFMGYDGKWNATNQIPLRAVDDGQLSQWGSEDPSDGGLSHRFSLSGKYAQTDADHRFTASLYAISSGMDLYNNFTYFLNDPVHGDQFHQHEDRFLTGGKAAYAMPGKLGGFDMENTIGTEIRDDQVDLGLFHTEDRAYLNTIRTDNVTETSGAIFAENRIVWLDKLRTVAGLRGDLFYGSDHSDLAANSGAVTNTLMSPKGSVIVGPWASTEFYLSAGEGYHSNDVRAATTTVSPTDGSALAPYPLLERAVGEEIGVRSSYVPHLQSSIALFQLHLAAEQVFDGDAGDTSPSGPSTRQGVEFSNFYKPIHGVILDGDVSYSKARFDEPVSDGITTGTYIAGSPAWVIGAGVAIDDRGPWFGGLQYRMFGPRPLTDDGSVRSSATNLVNARVGYKLTDQFSLRLDIDNLFDSNAQQIAYYYTSRLQGEPADGVNDVHFHPAEPLGVRISLVGKF